MSSAGGANAALAGTDAMLERFRAEPSSHGAIAVLAALRREGLLVRAQELVGLLTSLGLDTWRVHLELARIAAEAGDTSSASDALTHARRLGASATWLEPVVRKLGAGVEAERRPDPDIERMMDLGQFPELATSYDAASMDPDKARMVLARLAESPSLAGAQDQVRLIVPFVERAGGRAAWRLCKAWMERNDLRAALALSHASIGAAAPPERPALVALQVEILRLLGEGDQARVVWEEHRPPAPEFSVRRRTVRPSAVEPPRLPTLKLSRSADRTAVRAADLTTTGDFADAASLWAAAADAGMVVAIPMVIGCLARAGEASAAVDYYRNLDEGVWISAKVAAQLAYAYRVLDENVLVQGTLAYAQSVATAAEKVELIDLARAWGVDPSPLSPARPDPFGAAAARFWAGDEIRVGHALVAAGMMVPPGTPVAACDYLATYLHDHRLDNPAGLRAPLALGLVASAQAQDSSKTRDFERMAEELGLLSNPTILDARAVAHQADCHYLTSLWDEHAPVLPAVSLRLLLQDARRRGDPARASAVLERLESADVNGLTAFDRAQLVESWRAQGDPAQALLLFNDYRDRGESLASFAFRAAVLAECETAGPQQAADRLEQWQTEDIHLAPETIERIWVDAVRKGQIAAAEQITGLLASQFRAPSLPGIEEAIHLASAGGHHDYASVLAGRVRNAVHHSPWSGAPKDNELSEVLSVDIAVNRVADVLAAQPDAYSITALVRLADMCAESREGDAAIRLLTATSRACIDTTGNMGLAICRSAADRPTAVLRVLDSIRDRVTCGARADWEVQYRAVALARLGRIDEAEHEITRAVGGANDRFFYLLMSAYAELGRPEDVERYLDIMRTQGVGRTGHHYHALMIAYTNSNEAAIVGGILERMAADGVEPTDYHWGSAIAARIALGDVDGAHAFLSELRDLGHECSPILYDQLLRAWVDVHEPGRAELLLNDMLAAGPSPDAKHYDAVMRGWLLAGDSRRVVSVYERMKGEGVEPDSYHYQTLLRALIYSDDLPGLQLAITDLTNSQVLDSYHARAAISGLLASKRYDEATRIVDAVPRNRRDAAVYLISGLAQANEPERAELILKQLEGRVTSSAVYEVAAAWSRRGDTGRCMQTLGTDPASTSHSRMGLALGVVTAQAIGASDVERLYHQALINQSIDALDTTVLLANAYADLNDQGAVRAQIARARALAAPRELAGPTLERLAYPLLCVGLTGDAVALLGDVEATFPRTWRRIVDELIRSNEPVLAEAHFRRACAGGLLMPADQESIFNSLLSAYHGSADFAEEIDRLKEEMLRLQLPVRLESLGAVRMSYDSSGQLSPDAGLRREEMNGPDPIVSMLGDVVHELSTPVATISGLARGAQLDHKYGADLRLEQRLKDLVIAADAMAQRVNIYAQLLQESGPLDVIEVGTAFSWTATVLRDSATEAGVVIHQQVVPIEAGRSLTVLGDMIAFRFVLRILISNSLEALARSSRPLGSRSVWLAAFEGSDAQGRRFVDVYVRDNGPGIPAEHRKRIFSHGYTTKSERGLGLGLSLVHSTVTGMQGTVRLNNTQDGAEFWLRFPAAEPDLENRRKEEVRE